MFANNSMINRSGTRSAATPTIIESNWARSRSKMRPISKELPMLGCRCWLSLQP
jgi:hypothetical protein